MKVRICSSPKRDIKKAEQDSEAKPDMTTSERTVAIPHSDPQNQQGKKRKYDEFFQVKIFISQMNYVQHSYGLILILSYCTYLNNLSTLVVVVIAWHLLCSCKRNVLRLWKLNRYRSGGPGSIPGTTRIKKYWVWNGVHSAS
jgi:hypothetical protein